MRTVTENEVVTVSVRYRVSTTVVLAGWMVPDLDLRRRLVDASGGGLVNAVP